MADDGASLAEQKVMRAIAARHRPRALAERREALAVHAAAIAAPVRKPVGWNSRPTKDDVKRENRSAAERRARAERRSAEDKAIADALAKRDKRWDHKVQSTPATMAAADAEQACVEARTRQGSLARLFKTGAIDAAQLASAIDIATVAERIGRDVAVRTASLETRIDAGRIGGGDFFERLGAVRREIAFTAWRKALGGSARVVLDMVVDDAGLVAAARAHGMGHRRATALLIDALDRWPDHLGAAIRAVDARDLDAAHARLAG